MPPKKHLRVIKLKFKFLVLCNSLISDIDVSDSQLDKIHLTAHFVTYFFKKKTQEKSVTFSRNLKYFFRNSELQVSTVDV